MLANRFEPWSNPDMDVVWMIDRLERFPAVVDALVGDCGREDALWRPTEQDWSILEIICHLMDEDLDDFGTRLRLLLESPDSDWPMIDPPAAATNRGYRDRNPASAIREFAAVRRTNVEWLRTTVAADYSIAARHPRLDHPRFGAMRAGDLLAAWCAHDALHLRQLARRLHQLTDLHAGEHRTGYAGDW